MLPSQTFWLLAMVSVIFIPSPEQGFGVLVPIVNGEVSVRPPPIALMV